MQEKTKEPEIRFAGFTGAWEQRKIKDLAANTYGGGTPSTSNPDFWEGSIPWIQSSDLSEHNLFRVRPRKFISQAAVTNSPVKIIPESSIAVITRVGVGKLAVMNFSYTTSQDFLSLSNLNTDVKFTSYQLYRRLQKDLNAVQGTSIKGITKEELLGKNIFIPGRQEQEAIGKFFSKIDSLLTLHQRKYEKLLNIKKSMLEKMFPKEGEVVPEIRFKGFTGAWEQRKLGTIVQITMGQSPDGSTYSDTPADYILVQGNADLKNGWVCPRVWTTQKTKFATAGDLIMSVRAPAGSVGKTAYDVVLGRGVASLKGNEFIYQSLVKMDFDGYWKAESTGSTFESLSSDSISTAELYCPSEDEQHKIGIFLSRLDSLLTLHQRKLEMLKNVKQAFLEKMFV